MDTIENKLKDLILSKYKSLREFTLQIEMPYSTLDTILKRGVDKANIVNILKICKELDISTDKLANGFIEFNNPPKSINSNLSKEEISLINTFNTLDNIDKCKLMDYSNLLKAQSKYKKAHNSISNTELCATISPTTQDTNIENPKEEKRERLQDYFTTIAAHNDDLTEEEKIIAEQKVLEALKKANLI